MKSSPVQEQAIPIILEGKDLFAQAETGSGKTGAFAIPVIEKIIRNQLKGTAIVLSPTRELAQQTYKIFSLFGAGQGLKIVNVIGGESINNQKDQLRGEVQVIVGTPGRINDLSKQRNINLKDVHTLVFDEADRLFDMGFKDDIEFLLRRIPKTRQIIMMSATSNQDVLRTAYRFHSQPEELCLSEDSLLVDNIDHSLVMLSHEEKFPYLVNYLNNTETSFIFCNTQIETHTIGEWLKAMDFKAAYISGKLAQNKRSRLMQDFRAGKIHHLVCTDVAARGLDINNVAAVINYQLPNDAENYVHRIGRTGRAGKSGVAVSLCAHEDCENLEAIKDIIQEDIPVGDVQESDFARNICKKPRIDRKTLRLIDRPKKEKKVKETTPKTIQSIPPFLVTAENFDEALNRALGHFNLKDPELLENKVIKKTGKKFLMFGKEEITYEFSQKTSSVNSSKMERSKKTKKPTRSKNKVKTGDKSMEKTTEVDVDLTAIPGPLQEFINGLNERLGLDLTFDIEVQDRRVKVDVRGEDIGLVLTNKKQLMYSFETVMRQFLFRRNLITRQSQLAVYAHGTNPKPAKTNRYDDFEEEENDNFGNREHHGEREFRGEDYGNAKHPKRQSRRRNNNARGNRSGRGRRDQRPQNHTDEFLQDMARILRDQVLEEGVPKLTKSLNPYERRIIHEALQEDQRVKTESEGDGKFKQIRISLINQE